jgi:tetratricopeptide (TPR) repeat protein
MYEKVKECFNILKDQHKEDGLLREEEASFLAEIGEYSEAIKSLNQAISIYSADFLED